MITILVPREDVNDDTVILTEWVVDRGQWVAKGQVLCQLETSKTVFEVCAPEEGYICPIGQKDEELTVGALLACLLPSAQEALDYVVPADPPAQVALASASQAKTLSFSEMKLTDKARALALEHHLELSGLKKHGIITVEDLKPLLAAQKLPTAKALGHNALPAGIKRVLVLGAGVAAMQVLDILLHDRTVMPIGCLDDNPALQGQSLFGVPVLGMMSSLETLWQQGAFDAGIVGVGTNLPVRKRLYERLLALGIPLVNAIDPSARINRHAVLGQGIVLCSFVHVGVNATIGDNCFLAAHTSVDHHCRLGNTVLLGPGCLLSGSVTVGSNVLFGSGVIVQPCLSIGEHCRLASGAVVINNVPDSHAVKNKISQEIRPIHCP